MQGDKGVSAFCEKTLLAMFQWQALTLYGGMPSSLTVKYLTHCPQKWPPKGNTVMNSKDSQRDKSYARDVFDMRQHFLNIEEKAY